MSGHKPKLYDTQLEKEEFNSVLDELLLGEVKSQFKKEFSDTVESLNSSHRKLLELHESIPDRIGEAVGEYLESHSKELSQKKSELTALRSELNSLRAMLEKPASNNLTYLILALLVINLIITSILITKV